MTIPGYTELVCPKCENIWMHRGQLLYATCPNCRKLFRKPKPTLLGEE